MELRKGTSIIELTIVIGLTSLLALAISSIMLTTITTTNRLRSATYLKQSGNYALTQLQTLIRNSQSLSTCDEINDTFTTQNPDGNTTIINLENDGAIPRIASNSGIYLTPNDVSVTNFTVTCIPSANPRTIKIKYDLSRLVDSGRSTENTIIHFETSTSLRNE